MTVLRSILLFALAALAEIGGAWLVWQGVREQGCCAFMSFTLTPSDGQLVADLQVPTGAAPTLDALAMLAELAAPGPVR